MIGLRYLALAAAALAFACGPSPYIVEAPPLASSSATAASVAAPSPSDSARAGAKHCEQHVLPKNGVLFADDFESGAAQWVTTKAPPCSSFDIGGQPLAIEKDPEAGSCPYHHQHETTSWSCGRVFMRHPIPVRSNVRLCVSAWIRSAPNGFGFVGILGSDETGKPNLSGGRWLIGKPGYRDKDGPEVLPVTDDGTWHQYKVPFVTPGTMRFAVVMTEMQGTGAFADFDDIRVIENGC